MRFKEVKIFGVDELLLDESNYRFKAAKDQKACIEKIYYASPTNFKNMMTSIAEDDLGEDLLVYTCDEGNIVLDGNRRLAAIKVLSNPKLLAPNDTIKEQAETLNRNHKVDFSEIRTQASSDRKLILRTVYERHAAGQGKSRIGWSAYGAARFRYDEKTEDSNEWYPLALLLATEEKHPSWTDFLDSNEYSHEVFRRIFKAALSKGVISRNIFSDRDKRIKASVEKKLLSDAIEKTIKFLQDMKKGELSLSRSGKYADKVTVEKYISQFNLSPDNIRSEKPKDETSSKADSNEDGNKTPNQSESGGGTEDAAGDKDNPKQEYNGHNNGKESAPQDNRGAGINKSQNIVLGLIKLNSQKLIGLYNSLCVVSVLQHPQLLYVGAWSFFETLSSLHGKDDKTSFDSYLGSKINENGQYNKSKKRDFKNTLEDINKKGNANKHSGAWHATSALQLRVDFDILETFILLLIEDLIARNEKND